MASLLTSTRLRLPRPFRRNGTKPPRGDSRWVLWVGGALAAFAGLLAGAGYGTVALMLIAVPIFGVVATAWPERTMLGLIVLLPFMFYPLAIGGFSVFAAVPLFGYCSLMLLLRERGSLHRLRSLLPVRTFGVLVAIAITMAALSDNHPRAFSRIVYLVAFGVIAWALAASLLSGRITREAVARAIVFAGAVAGAALVIQFVAQFGAGRSTVIDWLHSVYPLLGGERAAEIGIRTSNWVIHDPELLRAVFPFMVPSSAGQFMMLGLVAGLWLRRERRAGGMAASALETIAVAIIVAALLFTFSRQSWVGAAAGVAALGLRRRPAWMLAIVGVLLLVAVMPVPGGEGSFAQYLLTASDTSTESSATRLNIWDQAIGFIPEHAAIGVGPGLYETLNPNPFEGGVYYGHNVFLDAAVEMGLAGGVALIALFLIALRSSLRNHADLAFAMLVAYIVAGLFDDVFYFPKNGILLGIIFALVVAGDRRPSPEEPPPEAEAAGPREPELPRPRAPVPA